MIVQVELHTSLQIQSSQGPRCCLNLTLPAGATCADALRALEIPYDPENLLLVVNRKMVEPQQVLQPGDKLDVIPAMSGG